MPAAVWTDVRAQLVDVLEHATLQDFVARAEASGVEARRAAGDDVLHLMAAASGIDDSILARIGRTPLVRLRRMPGAGAADVLVKCEQMNPGGSVKDRPALAMIEAAEREGRLVPGRSVIVEATSGNTGVGLALVAAVKGYRLILTMPENMSPERMALLRAYGAELHLTPAERVMRGAVDKANAIAAANPSAFMPEQFKNPTNPGVHLATTGPGDPGAARRARRPTRSSPASARAARSPASAGRCARVIPDVAIIGVEPAASAVLSGGAPGPHRIQGIGAGFVPEILDRGAARPRSGA